MAFTLQVLAAELPPVGTSRSMAARFREYESGDGNVPTPDRKPVRKMTPPREELAQSISQARDEMSHDPNVIKSGENQNPEEELPPAQFTRSMLAKFQQLEDPNAPAPTPERSAQISATKRVSTASAPSPQPVPVNRPSADSGIAGLDDQDQPANFNDGDYDHSGGVSENTPAVLPGVVRESDTHDEVELPEKGTTRSLLAQWRNMEQTVKTSHGSPSPPKPKQSWGSSSGRSPAVNHHPATRTPQSEHDHIDASESYQTESTPERDVIRYDDAAVEDEMPPPSFTRNMLAKFQNMQAEAERDAANLKTPPPQKKVQNYFTEIFHFSHTLHKYVKKDYPNFENIFFHFVVHTLHVRVAGSGNIHLKIIIY